MKKRLVVSLLFVFALALSAPVFASALPQEPAKKECADKKEACTEKKEGCTEKKAEGTEKKDCSKATDAKPCCSKKAEEPKK